MLLIDDEPEEELPIKEELIQSRKGRSIRPSPNKGLSNEKLQRSIERKKSIENGVALPAIPNKRTYFK